ncbi:histidinolphosphatase [Tulasnella sp. JGI-2019a]|nr:histidinolphosphatase [Tulasnella sp. JGI-2019a]KAG9032458.1 histidinolphosphatase [Tulasnella sp. JGI-2019a]
MTVQSSNPRCEDPAADSMDILVHKPDSTESCFAPNTFPYHRLMERWAVMASTLPLWKDRKNVMISYSQIDDKPINETFRDTIQFNFSEKAGPGKEPTTVEGVDTLQMIEPGDEGSAAESETKAGNGVRYKWKGSGIMAVSPPAQWQVLGFFLANDPNRSNEDWVVTYFGKTLATPAGLDIYVRNPKAFDISKVRRLINACQQNGDETVRRCAEGFFEIPRDL